MNAMNKSEVNKYREAGLEVTQQPCFLRDCTARYWSIVEEVPLDMSCEAHRPQAGLLEEAGQRGIPVVEVAERVVVAGSLAAWEHFVSTSAPGDPDWIAVERAISEEDERAERELWAYRVRAPEADHLFPDGGPAYRIRPEYWSRTR